MNTSAECFWALYNFAMDNKIIVQVEDSLSPLTPSVSDSATRRVMINANWHIRAQLPFHLAHEISHVLNGDSNVLYFTPSKDGIEGQANRDAVALLVPLYFAETDQEDANVQRFVDAFHIPESMYEWALESINQYYS